MAFDVQGSVRVANSAAEYFILEWGPDPRTKETKFRFRGPDGRVGEERSVRDMLDVLEVYSKTEIKDKPCAPSA